MPMPSKKPQPHKPEVSRRFAGALDRLADQGRLRSLNLPAGLDLTSNDYLGFAHHPDLRACAVRFLSEDTDVPVGAAGSRLLRGHQGAHDALERLAADIFGAPAALYLANGFLANYALITTLMGRHDTIIYDEHVHASMRDGIAASKAKSVRAAHNDLAAFETALKQAAQDRRADGEIWVLIESVYSMDGDCAPLDEMIDLAARYGAMMIIDEAHATGILGADGRGAAYAEAKASDYDRIITLHTCGKALGVAGALICARRDIVNYMVNAARPFIYSTAPLPVQAALVQAALELMISPQGDQMRSALQQRCDQVQAALGGSGSHIVPLIVGEDKAAVDLASRLQERGYDIRAIRPPTVPEGTARLRLSLSAALSRADLEGFIQTYKDIINA